MSASGPRRDRRAHLQANRLQDVALLAVEIMNQSDAGRAVRIVFDRRNLARYPILLALEVDQAQHLLVAAALMAHGQVALVAASAGALLDRQKRLVRPIRRQVVIDLRGLEAQGRRDRSVCLDCHRRLSRKAGTQTRAPLSRFSGTHPLLPDSDNLSWVSLSSSTSD